MRVLEIIPLVSDEGSFGGPLTVAVNQASALAERGHETVLAAGWAGSGEPPNSFFGIPAVLRQARPSLPGSGFSGLVSPALWKWLLQHCRDFDIAHLHTGRHLMSLVPGRMLRGRLPYVTQTHGMVMPDQSRRARVLDGALTVPVLLSGGCNYVLTDLEQAGLREVLVGRGNIQRLPNGVRVGVARVEDGPAGEPADVLFLARLQSRKRVMDFLEMAAILHSRNRPARFSIVGPDEGELPRLRRGISELGLHGLVTYEGALPPERVQARLLRASVYVLPSVDEPFPMSLLESLVAGIPAVCTTSCGIAGTLSKWDAAGVVPPGGAHLADAVDALLLDPGLRRQRVLNARKVIDAEFSISAVASRLETDYAKVLASGARASRRRLSS